MAKKIILAISIVLFSGVIFINNTFAAGFSSLYTTDSDGSTTPKASFNWDERPWLYSRLPSSSLNIVSTWWQDPTLNFFYAANVPNNNQEQWLTISNWNNVKKSGPWNISASYFYANNPNNPFGTGSTTFNVTPEPISSALFLFGSVTLALGVYRRKITKNLVKKE